MVARGAFLPYWDRPGTAASDGTSLEMAALAEPLAVCVHAVP